MGICFKTLNPSEEIPRVGYATLARWQTDIYEILKNTDIDCVVIEYTRDEGD
jgi:hypothetical protein